MPDTAVDAIVFDVGGVLLAHDNDLLFRTLASRCTLPGVVAEMIRARATKTGIATGHRPVSDVHERLVSEFGYVGDWEGFRRDWCCHFTLDPKMIDLARALAARNRFLLFSNTNSVHWEFVVAMGGGALARFERYASHELGDAKPAISAFEKVASLAGIDPSRSIFIDDVAEYVEGARQVGFTAHQFNSRPSLERFLREAGIQWD